ncbi:hypothetical protein SNEBB_007299 [Seison nebaliae]|nr:hypothetical protein SNEBB_007299 [Seison nebaliae]
MKNNLETMNENNNNTDIGVIHPIINFPLRDKVVAKSFDELTSNLDKLFVRKMLNSEELDQVASLMSHLEVDESQWSQFAKFDPLKYTRNIISRGNGFYNLILLCWSEGQASSIHDHTNASCFMKIMKGTLIEDRYEWPKINSNTGMKLFQSTKLETDQVAYINDDLGLHRVKNNSNTDVAVSLHLYMPPFTYCNKFDERSGLHRRCGMN